MELGNCYQKGNCVPKDISITNEHYFEANEKENKE